MVIVKCNIIISFFLLGGKSRTSQVMRYCNFTPSKYPYQIIVSYSTNVLRLFMVPLSFVNFLNLEKKLYPQHHLFVLIRVVLSFVPNLGDCLFFHGTDILGGNSLFVKPKFTRVISPVLKL